MTFGKLGLNKLLSISAKDYVKDNLVAMWDGIENIGWGQHDNNTSIWKDLIGERDATIVNGIFSNNCLENDGT